MAIYPYRLAGGQTRWMFTIDLPPAADGKRRQMNRKGFVSQESALAAETEARKAFAHADLAADGSLAVELENWLRERELDLQPTTPRTEHPGGGHRTRTSSPTTGPPADTRSC